MFPFSLKEWEALDKYKVEIVKAGTFEAVMFEGVYDSELVSENEALR